MCPVILDLDLLMKDIIGVFGEARMEFEAQGVTMCQCQPTSRFYPFYCDDIGVETQIDTVLATFLGV